jgi:hypothetical protein
LRRCVLENRLGLPLARNFQPQGELSLKSSTWSVVMATSAKRALKSVDNAGESVSDALLDQIAALRNEIAAISEAVSDYGGHSLSDVQHNAVALAKEVRHQGAVVARQVNRQAGAAGKAIQENPIPVIVVLGTIALLSALIFMRD